jgi:hypothetical protein
MGGNRVYSWLVLVMAVLAVALTLAVLAQTLGLWHRPVRVVVVRCDVTQARVSCVSDPVRVR